MANERLKVLNYGIFSTPRAYAVVGGGVQFFCFLKKIMKLSKKRHENFYDIT